MISEKFHKTPSNKFSIFYRCILVQNKVEIDRQNRKYSFINDI